MKGAESTVKKIDTTALQRFKNQNLLLKKFGESGLLLYKHSDGKKTLEQIRTVLGTTEKEMEEIIDYMKKMGMIEIISSKETGVPIKKEGEHEEKIEQEEEPEEEKKEEAPAEEEKESEKEEEFEGIEPIAPKESEEEEQPKEETEEENREEKEEQEEEPEEEIEPAEEEKIEPREEEPEEEKKEEKDSAEKTIQEKYGPIGIAVYNLIDGLRSSEEIMKETGLTESKLVEILNFFEKEGIIKLEYPDKKGKGTEKSKEAPGKDEMQKRGFSPIVEEKSTTDKPGKEMDTIDVPVRLQLDIIKSVQINAKIILEFGEHGSNILREIDGKSDIIEISIKTKQPLYKIMKVMGYLLERNVIMMKPLNREDIKKKYGNDAYTIYKRFGKEGVLLYQLIDEDLTIPQLADRITKDKQNFIEIFLFAHKVLGVPIPADKDLLYKKLGIG